MMVDMPPQQKAQLVHVNGDAEEGYGSIKAAQA